MMIYHAFEIATDGCFHLWADTDPESCQAELQRQLSQLGDAVEDVTTGTVEATSIEDAHDAIRHNDWLEQTKVRSM